MARVIACCNAKGGVGKTTVAINLAHGLARRNKRVLIVDLDPQSNAAIGLGIQSKSFGNRSSFQMMIHPLSVNGQDLDVSQFIYKNARPKLDLIPNKMERKMEVQLSAQTNRERLLQLRLRQVANDYDYIICDCPPALETATMNALVASDMVLIVISPGYFDLEGLDDLMQECATVRQEFGRDDLIIRALMNNVDQRQLLDKHILAEAEKYFETLMFRTVINKTVKLGESAINGNSIFEHTPAGTGAFDFTSLTKELMEFYGESQAEIEKRKPVSSRHS